jgi:lipopolysaccharide transport system ATP-binding protein
MSDDVLVRVDNVSKRFCRNLKRSLWYGLQDLGSELGGRRHGGGGGLPQSSADVELRNDEFWAVKDVSFELRRGECLGLIGHNGAGKTTLLKMLNGLIKPDCGWIKLKGRVGALIALGSGFNPILTGRENIYINASVLGFSKDEIDDKIEGIIDFAEIGDFIDTPVQNYSSGMQVRLGFAVAVNLKPDILLIDEVLAVGDIGFKQKAYAAIYEAIKNAAVIFVSHSISQVSKVCNRGLLLKSGKAVKFSTNVSSVIDAYNSEFSSPLNCRTFGPGQARLRSCTVLSNGLESNNISFTPEINNREFAVQHKDTLEIRFNLDIDNSIKKFYLGIGFVDMGMQGVAQCSSINCGGIFDNNSNGFLEIKVSIPDLPLSQGTYEMFFRVQESNWPKLMTGKNLCLYDNLLTLQVKSNISIWGWYPVQLKGDWNIC